MTKERDRKPAERDASEKWGAVPYAASERTRLGASGVVESQREVKTKG